jgi:hypothetical protein
MILIVTYDLKSPKDYHDLYETLKQQGNWSRYMTSTWLLSTDKTPNQVVDAITPFLDSQDLLFVCELSANYQGRLPRQAWEWINATLKPPTDYVAGFLSGLGTVRPPPKPSNPLADAISSLLNAQSKKESK